MLSLASHRSDVTEAVLDAGRGGYIDHQWNGGAATDELGAVYALDTKLESLRRVGIGDGVGIGWEWGCSELESLRRVGIGVGVGIGWDGSEGAVSCKA